jgi:cell fate regulator YaaT (PSP1 superfamily)
MSKTVLVRYGAISEVSRFVNASGTALCRGTHVVVQSHRGLESGLLLEDAPADDEQTSGRESDETAANTAQLLRTLTDEDRRAGQMLRSDCEADYARWQTRIREWNLQLELIDLEWTLDRSKLILYVLNDRGPECTRLALQAAAAGLGIVEVQSVGPDGLVTTESGHGCGSGGCGSGGGSNGCCH